ncbi:zinc ribbon domain-containing protein [uncultured Veillonella sp.]|uniref:zinc ribbon domain-containing protein n=1 Tax=uncultured Veillonella sp. TaxID=159268 RepID=UPI0025F735FE|nr:zinc ribbon domain-containing protein [uncultured Veillonella sp.]MDY3974002.1 zinc ribbon domain-containing protein [Veillonella caviae]
MFCMKCGSQLADDAKFCTVCGTAMEDMIATNVASANEMPSVNEAPPVNGMPPNGAYNVAPNAAAGTYGDEAPMATGAYGAPPMPIVDEFPSTKNNFAYKRRSFWDILKGK